MRGGLIMGMRQIISDYDLEALLDNALPQDQAGHLRLIMEIDYSVSQRYEALMRQKELLKLWWASKHPSTA